MTPNTRKPEETFEAYKQRMAKDTINKRVPNYTLVWDSSVKPKTYIRAKHGELQ